MSARHVSDIARHLFTTNRTSTMPSIYNHPSTIAARRIAIVVSAAAALVLASCGGESPARQDVTTSPPPPIVLTSRDVATVQERTVPAGPIISGTLVPRVKAVVRAETGGAVLAVLADRGSAVRAGAPLARIADHLQRAAHASASADVRSAESAVESARRRAERLERLLAGGAVSAEDAEDGRQAVRSAESQLEAARSRMASASEALAHTVVRAPIAGIVSVRSVDAGDLVQPATAMFEVLDPSSMRLEAAIPSAQLGVLELGAAVEFTVAAYPGRVFTGRIERVSPSVDAATRQVPVTVTIDNRDGRLVAGLFAEGRITVATRNAVIAPASAVSDERGSGPSALRVTGGRVSRVPVDARLDRGDEAVVEIVSGLAVGDTVLVGRVRERATPGAQVRMDTLSAAVAAATPR
jgi:RND family efflux transporter MFP subunit